MYFFLTFVNAACVKAYQEAETIFSFSTFVSQQRVERRRVGIWTCINHYAMAPANVWLFLYQDYTLIAPETPEHSAIR